MDKLDKKINILWEQKSQAPSNIWGVETGSTDTKLDRKVDGGLFGGTMMFNRSVGPFAQLILLILLCYIVVTSFWSEYTMAVFIFVFLVFVFSAYRFFIRELKYYQLAKNTTYQITKEEILIKYAFLGFKKILRIDLNEISNLHEVEYQFEDVVKGSIWIYHTSDVRAYDVVKKERTNLPRIQMVQNHKEALRLLRSLVDLDS